MLPTRDVAYTYMSPKLASAQVVPASGGATAVRPSPAKNARYRWIRSRCPSKTGATGVKQRSDHADKAELPEWPLGDLTRIAQVARQRDLRSFETPLGVTAGERAQIFW